MSFNVLFVTVSSYIHCCMMPLPNTQYMLCLSCDSTSHSLCGISIDEYKILHSKITKLLTVRCFLSNFLYYIYSCHKYHVMFILKNDDRTPGNPQLQSCHARKSSNEDMNASAKCIFVHTIAYHIMFMNSINKAQFNSFGMTDNRSDIVMALLRPENLRHPLPHQVFRTMPPQQRHLRHMLKRLQLNPLSHCPST